MKQTREKSEMFVEYLSEVPKLGDSLKTWNENYCHADYRILYRSYAFHGYSQNSKISRPLLQTVIPPLPVILTLSEGRADASCQPSNKALSPAPPLPKYHLSLLQ